MEPKPLNAKLILSGLGYRVEPTHETLRPGYFLIYPSGWKGNNYLTEEHALRSIPLDANLAERELKAYVRELPDAEKRQFREILYTLLSGRMDNVLDRWLYMTPELLFRAFEQFLMTNNG